MPQIDLIPEVYYNALNPYHYYYDNLPLRNIITRISLVNDTVDTAYNILRSAVGTQGTLDNRLNQSIMADGSLKDEAIDASLHNIGAHADGTYGGVEYVRMQKAESDKLSLIADGATDIKLIVPVGDTTTVLFDTGTIEFSDTTGITWSVTGGNKVKANLAFPASSAHSHYYDVQPINTGNYKNYKTTSVSTPCMTGTLRVYINGFRINNSDEVYVPVGVSRTLTLMKFTPDESAGTFVLSTAISSIDIIRIDFDTSYV